jgi:four helix bundle protein
MANIDSFEDLRIWQEARALTNLVYRLTKGGAIAKDFRFCDQIRSASISIMNNISEGFESGYDKRFINFLFIAKGSSGEVRSMAYAGLDLGYFSEDQQTEIINKSRKISSGIKKLIDYLRQNPHNFTHEDSILYGYEDENDP